jgi:hypothetical protein
VPVTEIKIDAVSGGLSEGDRRQHSAKTKKIENLVYIHRDA